MSKRIHVGLAMLLLLSSCSSEDWTWDLPRTNPVDPEVNSTAVLPVTLPTLITSNSTAVLRGQVQPYTPGFEGAVALEWKTATGDWNRESANEDATGLFESPLGGLSPGAQYTCRAWLGLGSLDVFGEELSFSMPVSAEDLGCTDATACNFDSSATFDDGSCEYAQWIWPDSDGDGFGDELNPGSFECPPVPNGYVLNGQDCDDDESTMYPGGPAMAMGLDNDCSGAVDDDEEIPPSACWVHHCEDLEGLTVDLLLDCSSVGDWEVGQGYEGNGLQALCSGTVAFEYDQPDPFKLSFWMVSYDAGSWTQDVPMVAVNGSLKPTEIITGDDQGGDGEDWHQRQTVTAIPAGAGTITIYMDGNGVYPRRLDELELWFNP